MTRVFDEQAIRAAVDQAAVVDAITEGFRRYSAGEVDVPPVGLLHFEDPPGDVHIKYGAIRGDDFYLVKVASGFYENIDRGLPVSDGSMLLYDRQTGEMLAVLLDRGWLTELRTGAAGAVAARLLAPPGVERIGMVGTGVQARFQLRALPAATACRRVMAWGRDPVRLAGYAAEMTDEGWEVEVTADLADIAAACDLIVTVTPAREPLLMDEWIRPGTHITAVGSDNLGKQELDPAILGRADVVAADSISQATHHGECAHGLASGGLDPDDIVELGAIVADPSLGRASPDQITLADLTGVAVQDIQVAKMAWEALDRQS